MKLSFLAVIVLLAVSAAQAQTPFYQGKTIRIVTGYPAGDVNDLWPRLIARHMGKYIPGNPSFIVQNMPGASAMIAANYVYGVAKPDGLTLGWIAPTLYFDQLVRRPEARYDWAKYSFIGSPAQSEHHLYMRTDSPYKTIEDVRKVAIPVLRHRVSTNFQAQAEGMTTEDVIKRLLAEVPTPVIPKMA